MGTLATCQHLPAHLHEYLEAGRTARGDGQVKVVAANTPDDGRGVNILTTTTPIKHNKL